MKIVYLLLYGAVLIKQNQNERMSKYMEKSILNSVLEFMKASMNDAAHDILHVYRVVNQAMIIAEKYENDVDNDVLLVACLLHDIGRKAQFENPAVCHAQVGADMAYKFLYSLGLKEDYCNKVHHCIKSHRYRTDNEPESIEAKILFDSDKLDITGALGISRTLLYKGQVNEPLYVLDDNHVIYTTEATQPESFIKEYHFKLSKVYDKFYTKEAFSIAQKRKKLTESFYEELIREIDMQKICSIIDI